MTGLMCLRPKMDQAAYPLLMEKSRLSHLPGGHITPFRVLHWLGPDCPRLYPNLNYADPVKGALLGDVRFREALSLGINREEINQVQFMGLGVPRQNAPTERSPFYDHKFESEYAEYDPARANAILDELGLTKRNKEGVRLMSDGKPLIIDISTSEDCGFQDALELVSRYWRELGIKSDLRILSPELFQQRYNSGLQEIYAWWYEADQFPPADDSIVPVNRFDPQARLWGLWYETNGEQGQRPSEPMVKIIDLWREMKKTPDLAQQIDLCKKVLTIRADNVYEIGLVSDSPVVTVVQDRMKNVPDVAYYDWYCRAPGNTAPECYVLMPEAE